MRIRLLALVAFAALTVAPARAEVVIAVDKAAQQMTVTVDDEQRFVWPVSTGIADYDTPAGAFQAFRMEKDHYSREWDDAPMPYSIFFTQDGHAIHGTYHKSLGRPASHGCVRLSVANAATLYALVRQQGMKQTKVVLTGELAQRASVTGSIIADETAAGTRKRSARVRDDYDAPRPYYREPYVPARRGLFPFGW